MRRRAFLMAAGAAALSPWNTRAQASLGTLAWVEDVAGGSLWVRDLPDGPPLKIAAAGGLYSPRFSPSGQWIAFQDQADKQWIVARDGQAVGAEQLPPEDRSLLHSKGVFALDGQRNVFSRVVPGKSGDDSRVGQLCVASLAAPADPEPQVLVTNEQGEMQPYAWTRDGKSIIYWSADEFSASTWSDGVPLKIVNVQTGMVRDLGVSALADEDMLDLAPSSAGNKLAVTDGDGRETWAGKRVAIIDLDTGAVRHFFPKDVASMCPSWSPDGSRIVCSAGPDADIAYNKANAGRTYTVVRPDGSKAIETITPDSNIGIGGGEEAHVYLQQRKIWLLDVTGGNPPKQLTSDARHRDEEPMWSRDGSHILFARMDYDGYQSLWLMEASGANAVEVCRVQVSDDFGNPDSWFGYYGYINWRKGFDWRR